MDILLNSLCPQERYNKEYAPHTQIDPRELLVIGHLHPQLPMSGNRMARLTLSVTPIQLDRSFVQRPNSPNRVAAGSRYHRGLPDRSIAHLPAATVQQTLTLPSLPWAICTAGGVDRTNLHTRHHEKPPQQSPRARRQMLGGPSNRTQKASVQGKKVMLSLGCHILTGRVGRKTWDSRLQNMKRCTELTYHSTRHRSP